MARDIFGDVVDPSIRVGSRKWYTVPLSIIVHTVILVALVIVPLIAADVLPVPPGMMNAFVAAAPPPPPPPSPPPRPAAARQVPKSMDVNPAVAPLQAPREIQEEPGVEQAVQNADHGVEGRVFGNGVPGGGVEGSEPAPPPPPPSPLAPVRVSSAIRSPQQLKRVNPVYPSIAQATRVQGVVILEAVIGVDGRVQDVRVLRSIPLLDAAAVDAVKQWIYTPTTLNSVAVPVIMTVTVNFTLQ